MRLERVLKGEISELELLNYYGGNITYISLPRFINGFVFMYRGIYNIYINKNLSEPKIKDTILHEIAHIELCHLNQCRDLFAFSFIKYEDEANEYVKELLNKIE